MGTEGFSGSLYAIVYMILIGYKEAQSGRMCYGEVLHFGYKEAQSGRMCYNWHNLRECLLLVKVR